MNENFGETNNAFNSENEYNIKSCETNIETKSDVKSENVNNSGKIYGYSLDQIKWSNVFFLLFLHVLAIYGYFQSLFNNVRIFTVIFVSVLSIYSGYGMSVGGHRLWAHKSFKARLPLRVILLILQTSTCNGSALSYARDHRTHHKWTDQEQDPKNPSRGLFYAHIGWWLLKKKQIVTDYGNKLNFQDLYDDPLLRFQHQFYTPLAILFAFIIPALIPYYFWTEDLIIGFLLCGCLRTCVILHHLFTVNSLAHYIGWRPYDKYMLPTENRLVIYLSLGEGNHNYHHTFPWDYSSSERNCWEFYNPSTMFINMCKGIGLAYDLKKPSKELVENVVKRKGIPEYFNRYQKQGLLKRILFGIFDWICGLTVTLWPVVSIIVLKAMIGLDMVVIHHSFEPYINWLRVIPSADNLIVYY